MVWPTLLTTPPLGGLVWTCGWSCGFFTCVCLRFHLFFFHNPLTLHLFTLHLSPSPSRLLHRRCSWVFHQSVLLCCWLAMLGVSLGTTILSFFVCVVKTLVGGVVFCPVSSGVDELLYPSMSAAVSSTKKYPVFCVFSFVVI